MMGFLAVTVNIRSRAQNHPLARQDLPGGSKLARRMGIIESII